MARLCRSPGAGRAVAGTVAACALGSALIVPPPALAHGSRARAAQVSAAVRRSRQLWATIDVCNPSDQPYTVGIRGSMPSDGQPGDAMMMRFRLQYLEPAAQRWIDLGGASSKFLAVGSSRMPRQAGRSFVLYAPAKGTTFVLRGVVSFQWRHSGHVAMAISRPTSAGHQSLAGADPAGYSAATCRIR
jgi:hypothetical protein